MILMDGQRSCTAWASFNPSECVAGHQENRILTGEMRASGCRRQLAGLSEARCRRESFALERH